MVENGDFCPLNDTDTSINMEKLMIRFLYFFLNPLSSQKWKFIDKSFLLYSSEETKISAKKRR